MSASIKQLGRKKEAAILALLSQRTVQDAARSVGVGERTLYRWMQEPDFDAAYQRARQAAFWQATARLQQMCAPAVSTLGKIMLDSNEPGLSNWRNFRIRNEGQDTIIVAVAKSTTFEEALAAGHLGKNYSRQRSNPMSTIGVADFIHRSPQPPQSLAEALESVEGDQSKAQSGVDCAWRREPCMSPRQPAVEIAFMKFRMVWMGPADEPDREASVPDEPLAVAQDRHPLRYEQHGTGMVRREESRNRSAKLTPLTNFIARIVQDIVLDNDVERSRSFGIEAALTGQKLFFVVPAAEFSRMNWVLRQLGPQAIIYPGQQQHARAAIQSLSGAIRQERIFTQLGWRKHDGHWVYLHAGGTVGA